jgi:hypothetical protein
MKETFYIDLPSPTKRRLWKKLFHNDISFLPHKDPTYTKVLLKLATTPRSWVSISKADLEKLQTNMELLKEQTPDSQFPDSEIDLDQEISLFNADQAARQLQLAQNKPDPIQKNFLYKNSVLSKNFPQPPTKNPNPKPRNSTPKPLPIPIPIPITLTPYQLSKKHSKINIQRAKTAEMALPVRRADYPAKCKDIIMKYELETPNKYCDIFEEIYHSHASYEDMDYFYGKQINNMEPWEVSAYRKKILEKNGSFEQNAGMDLDCWEGVLEGMEERAGFGRALGELAGVRREKKHKFDHVTGRKSS